MGIEQKVEIIIGASQGIGAALVKGYRDSRKATLAAHKRTKWSAVWPPRRCACSFSRSELRNNGSEPILGLWPIVAAHRRL